MLDALETADVPLGAYDIIARVGDRHRKVTAPSIYRALGRLLDRGKIDRIETLSAYSIHRTDKIVHAICNLCGSLMAIAAPQAVDAIYESMDRAGFSAHHLTVEATGHCAGCAATIKDDQEP